MCTHPRSIDGLLAGASARGHGLGGSAGFGALRAIRRQGGLERASLGQGAFASAAAALARLARLARRLAGLLALGSVCRWPASEIRPTAPAAQLLLQRGGHGAPSSRVWASLLGPWAGNQINQSAEQRPRPLATAREEHPRAACSPEHPLEPFKLFLNGFQSFSTF